MLIIGGGVVGYNAAQMAVGMHADVTILDRNQQVLEKLESEFAAGAKVLYSTQAAVEEPILRADLVIGAVLVPGASAPKLITKPMLKTMKQGAVLVDVAIDQGGCFETSRPTTHAEPTYMVDGIVHYCVANMPGGVARTSTYALNNATLRHVIASPKRAGKKRCRTIRTCATVSTSGTGQVLGAPVAQVQGYEFVSPKPRWRAKEKGAKPRFRAPTGDTTKERQPLQQFHRSLDVQGRKLDAKSDPDRKVDCSPGSFG